MRDIWQTTNVNYGAKWGLATYPKKLNSYAIKRILERDYGQKAYEKHLKKEKRDTNTKQLMDLENSTKLEQNKLCVH